MTYSRVRRFAVAILMLVVIMSGLLGGVVQASTPTPDPHHPDSPAVSSPTAADPCANVADMTGMMESSPMAGMGMTQEFDLMFIDMMISHHESAVAMAKVAVVRAEHEEIRTLALGVISSQEAEIAQMRIWRDAWYPGAPSMPMDAMNASMMGMMEAMPGMMGTPIADMAHGGAMMNMDPAAELNMLCTASGPFDQVFMEMMISHHQSAVMMAEIALQHATHPEILTLAQAIIAAQQAEITQMQAWLVLWYSESSTS